MAIQPFSPFNFFLDSIIDWVAFLFNVLENFKHYLHIVGNGIVGERDSLLAMGLVLGVQIDQNSSLGHKLKTIGISNLWSASGLSVNLLIGSFSSAFQRVRIINLLNKTIFLVLTAFLFWMICDQSASLLRASISVVLVLVIRDFFGRQLSSIRKLVYVVITLLLFDPAYFHLFSFRFSISAVFGIVCLFPFLQNIAQNYLFPNTSHKKSFLLKLAHAIYSNFALFLSIQIGMLPLISSTWGEISLTNLIITTVLSCFSKPLFYYGLIWCCWCLSLFFLSFLLNLSTFFSALSEILLLPLQILLELNEDLSQVVQLKLSVPEFSNLAVVIWYFALFFIYLFHQSRKNKKTHSLFSLKYLAKTWSYQHV